MRSVLTGIILTVFLSVNFGFANVEKGQVAGKIIDEKTNQPLEFVTVSVKKKGAATYLAIGATSDEKGEFVLTGLDDGTYTVLISSVGYNPLEQDVTISSSSRTVNLNQIMLSQDAVLLNEAQVVGMRSQMKFDIDKKVFNVDQSIATTGGSASDILSNIPSVEVDNEGEVSLRGNTSVTIWINGKASGLSADNRAQILEQLPAESIERIEVITNPSAKFSPEGTAGIINIILKQNRKAGYYGSAQVGGNTLGAYNASANINYSSSKIDAYANIGYRRWENEGKGESKRLNYDTDTITNENIITYLNQNSENDGHGNRMFGRLGMTYHLTPKDHITVGGFGMLGDGKNNSTTNSWSDDPSLFAQRRSMISSDNDMKGGNIEIGYKHEFSEESNIDLTISRNSWSMDGTSVKHENSLKNDGSESSLYQRQITDINSSNWEFQLDYVTKLSEHHKIEAGYKGTLGRENSPFETFSGTEEGNAEFDAELYNRFIYDRNVHAAYATYSGRLNKLSYQLGLRGEYSDISTKSPAYNQPEDDATPYTKDYFSMFPTIFLSYSLPNDNEVQVNYTRRISRPWGGQLNPFVNVSDTLNISFGNPYLSPQYSNSFELNYIKNWNNHMLSFSGYYRSTDDVIQRIRYREGKVMKSTYENIAQTTSTGTEIVAKNKLFTRLDLTTTLNLYYYKLDGFSYMPEGATEPVIGEPEDNFSWNVRMIANIMLPEAFTLQLTGNYNSKRTIAQGYREPNHSLDAGVRKSFNKLSVSVSGRDLLNSRKWHSVTSGEGFEQDSWNRGAGRHVGLTLTYSFGNMSPKKKQQNREQQGGEMESYESEGA